MYNQQIDGVNFIICNTDAQALAQSEVPNRVQLVITSYSIHYTKLYENGKCLPGIRGKDKKRGITGNPAGDKAGRRSESSAKVEIQFAGQKR